MLITLAAVSVYANGRQERPDSPVINEKDLIKVEGELLFGNFGEPFIVQDGIAYVLRVPYVAGELDKIKEGDKIVAEGYAMPMRRFWNADKTRIIRIVKGSVNGKEIDIKKLLDECPYPDGPRFDREDAGRRWPKDRRDRRDNRGGRW